VKTIHAFSNTAPNVTGQERSAGCNYLGRPTDRRRSVSHLICKGFRNGEIALQLSLSGRAVKACAGELLLIFDVSKLAGMLALESDLPQAPELAYGPHGPGSALEASRAAKK
jgi:FixJ family two-component response regulator